jgi:diadenosine tetraphosphatase ApaH/serine/threonine PP2A family protein phosphatase
VKIALITDIHANREAFEACYTQARRSGAQQYALLGDFVGYGADPSWVVRQVRALADAGAIVVKGNHDEGAVRGPIPTMSNEAQDAVLWTQAQLSASQLDFLAKLPMTVQAHGCLFVHANAWAPTDWDYVTNRDDALRSLRATPARHTFAGHVHEPRLYHLSSDGKIADFKPGPAPRVTVQMPAQRQWLALPGSAGQPRDGNPDACWALFDTDTLELTFIRTPYDYKSAAAKIIAAGLPERLARRLHGLM